jgi:hypothetical protein
VETTLTPLYPFQRLGDQKEKEKEEKINKWKKENKKKGI